MAGADTVDVAVVGSGGAGLAAALAASAGGSRVLVLEKSELLGGTTALSGGAVWVPCNHHLGAVGASDSREEALTNGCTKINTRLKVFPEDLRLRWINDAPAAIFD